MSKKTSEILDEAADELFTRLLTESNEHWVRFIFERKHPQQTPFDLYVATHGKETMDLINRLRAESNRIEDEEND